MQPRHPRRPKVRAVRREIVPGRSPRPGRRSGRRLRALLLLAVMVGAALYLWREARAPQTAPSPVVAVRSGTVEQALEVDGLIIRREQVVTAPVAGRVHRLAAEGERVRVGAPVVEIAPAAAPGTQAPAEPGAVGRHPGLSGAASTAQREYDRLNAEIYRLVVELNQAIYAGEAEKVAALEAVLDDLARRQSGLISQLNWRAGNPASPYAAGGSAGLPAAPGAQTTRVASEVAGVVLYQTDGLESILRPGEADRWTPSWLRSLPYPDLKETAGESVSAGQPLFKVVDDLDLEMVIVVPAGTITPSQRTLMAETGVALRMAGSERPITAAVRRMVEEGEELLLHLRIPMPASEALRVRRMRVTLLLESFAGIIVPRSAIDVVDGRTGLWVRTAGDYRFTPVRVLGGNRDEVAVEGDLPPDALVLRAVPPPGR